MARSRVVFVAFLASVLVTCPSFARAEPDPGAPAPEGIPARAPPGDAYRDAALDLFRRGMALFRSGDLEQALPLLLESRRLFESKGNTLNAAICLERLGRFDEALELYEETVASFGARLDQDERAAIPRVLEALRAKIGSLEISANVRTAAVLVDGRERAKLPLGAPVRLLPGVHLVRLMSAGYQPFEQKVRLEAGQRTKLDATLERLKDAGSLRVEDSTEADMTVFVDGAEVGVAPWEGILAPGNHVVWSKHADHGSEPTSATVLAGQTALVRLHSSVLGSLVIVNARPATAAIRLSTGVKLGVGTFRGTLPVGNYDLDVEEEGYHSERVHVVISATKRLAPVDVALVVDPQHPRWPRPATGEVLIGISAGFGLGATLGAGAESACPDGCTAEDPALGTTIFARAGYEFPFRLAVEAAIGHFAVKREIHRDVRESADAHYALRDVLGVDGFAFGIAAAYHFSIAPRLDLFQRITGGLLLASSRDAITGSAVTRTGAAPVQIARTDQELSSTPAFLYPEVGIAWSLGRLRLGGSIGAFSVLGGGPTYDHGAITVPVSGCSSGAPNSAACLPDSSAVSREKAYDPFVLFTLQLSAIYVI
jgi:hypothetical protein